MKHLVLIAIFALAAAPVLAEQGRDTPNWVRVGTGTDQYATTFVDLNSIRAGNGYRLASVREVFKAGPNAVSEIHAQYEVDCKEPSVRILSSRFLLEGGAMQERGGPENWINVLPDNESGVRALQKAICAARVRG